VFTVILLSKSAREEYEAWQELFLPFLEDGTVALCEWNHESHVQTLSGAVPGLSEAIRGKDEWRLLVVGTGTEGKLKESISDPENPFDYIDNWVVDASDGEGLDQPAGGPAPIAIKESVYPLVRLSHMLLGFPEVGVRSFSADPSYRDKERQKRVYESDYIRQRVEQGLTAEEARNEFHELLPTRHDVQVHYKQSHLSDAEEQEYRRLVKKYEVRQSRPAEVVFLSVRDPIPPRPVDELRAAWKRGDRWQASTFVERNGYHPACRFVVYDLQAEDHTAYELGEFRFWLSVLTLSVNELPASALQTERLYAINVDLDADKLSATLNSHMADLANARERLNLEIRRPRAVSKLDVEDLLQETPVAVSFEHLQGDELSVPTTGYGLASDRPSSNMVQWEESYLSVQSASEIFNRKPKRVLAKAVEGTRESQTQVPEFDNALTDIEREELEEELGQRIHRLTEATTRDILDKQRLNDVLSTHRKRIRATILGRMSSSTILWSSLAVGLIWLAVFVPALIQARRFGSGEVAATGGLVLAVAVILALVAFLMLRSMRRRLINQLRGFNHALRAYVNGVKDGASAFAQFLTDVETYMKGRGLLDAEDERAKADRIRRQEFTRDLNRIKDVIAREKSLVRSVDRPVEIRRIAQSRIEIDEWSSRTLRRLLALTPKIRDCAFNKTGEVVKAPFDFVTRLHLKDQYLKENSPRQQELLQDLATNTPDPQVDHG